MFYKKTVFAAVLLSVAYFCFIGANKLTTAANAIVLQYTSTIFVMIYSVIFLKQKFKRIDYIVAILTFVGIALFFIDGIDGGKTLGNIISLFAGATLAGMYFLAGNITLAQRLSSIWLAHIFTAMIGVPFVFLTHASFTLKNLLFVLLLGVMQIGIPYIFFSLAVEHCPPFACSLIAVLEPLLNPLWVYLQTGETIGFISLNGGVLVVSSVTFWCVCGDLKKGKR